MALAHDGSDPVKVNLTGCVIRADSSKLSG